MFGAPRVSSTPEKVAGSLGGTECCFRMLMPLDKASASCAGVRDTGGLVALCGADTAKLAPHALGSSVGSDTPLTLSSEQRDGQRMRVHNDSI